MNKIQQEAEKRYPSEYKKTFVKDAFIAGATYEQERSKVLVEALEKIVGNEQASDKRWAFGRSLEIAHEALKTYQNE
jgi:hypothetical protein